MKKRILAAAVLIFVIGALGYLTLNHNSTKRPPAEENKISQDDGNSKNPAAAPSTSVPENPVPTLPSAPVAGATANAAPVPSVPVASTPESVSVPPATILDNMRVTIRAYGLMFGGNPVGTNPEITKVLGGDNPKQVNFLKADGNRVNSNGELVDAWGTPYFFHQISRTEMEIHSAGPDRIMWTLDDLVTK
jgi:hypothetical protein